VEAVLGTAEDPRLPVGVLDAVLIVNAYHEMPAYEAMLNRLLVALKPGGRLVLVEPWSRARRTEPRADQIKDHLIAPELAEQELRRAGFAALGREEDFVPREQSPEWLIQARRPAPSVPPGCSAHGRREATKVAEAILAKRRSEVAMLTHFPNRKFEQVFVR
jgi:SAM-dependent methyltransferase